MNVYEKENAREWQLDPGNQQSKNGGDSDSDEDKTVACLSKGPSLNRFAAIAPGSQRPNPTGRPTHQSPKRNSRPSGRSGNPPPRPHIGPVHKPANTPAPPKRPPAAPPQTDPQGSGINQAPNHTLPRKPPANTSPQRLGQYHAVGGAIPRTKDPPKPGDWQCGDERCRYHNFAKNVSCLRCGASQVGTAVLADSAFPSPMDTPVSFGVGSPSVARIPGPARFAGASPKVTFSVKEDNTSKAAFRRGKLHNQTFTLNTTCEQIEPDRSLMYARLEEIGVRFGSFIRPPQHLRDRTLLIWGDEKQVAETINELKHWASLTDQVLRGARETTLEKNSRYKFGKTGERQEEREREINKKIQQEVKTQAFQKDPVDGEIFEFQGYFLWPANEVEPKDLLGASCEAFDPIRTWTKSHIVWDSQISCFKILSASESAVQNAIQRIEGTFREYAARSSTTYAFNLVHFPEASGMYEEVKTIPGPSVGSSNKPSKIPILTGKALNGHALTAFKTTRENLTSSGDRKIKRSLSKIITRLPNFRGQLRMRVYFGTFALETMRWPGGAPTITYTEFSDNVTDTGTAVGTVIRDLQFQITPEALVGRCTSSAGLFEAIGNAVDDVEEVVPVYTARFIFNNADTGNVTLEVELGKQLEWNSVYEVTRTHWTRNDKVEMTSPFDVNVITVAGGCSWKAQISHDTVIDNTRVTPRMADFASSVAYKTPPTGVRPELTGCKVFKHAYNLQYESFEQKTALRFQHKDNSAWVFEFARYDTFSPNVSTASAKTQWGASLWHAEWDNILGENADLSIGQAAKWSPKFDTFFPSTIRNERLGIDGFQDFLHKVQDVTSMLDRMKGVPKQKE